MTERTPSPDGSVDGSRPPESRPVGDVRENAVYRVKAEMFRTLGHPARLRLLELLADGESTVSALQAALDLDSSAASQHVPALRRHGLLQSRKAGTSVYCRLRDHRPLEMLTLAGEVVAAGLQPSELLRGVSEQTTDPRPGSTPARAVPPESPPQADYR